ncbi:MAG: hypothetical protein Unbinned200contig1002_6 [Prokaryotic dsDNA virus sp.]|jgi:hypothetical protein|nr:hypothetical protein [Flavobacteriaceae bacterium]QDP68305.1 MAG: hypothetical protein Unbinned200contig1002_6 [Prokaryotic dsDNA virus sp.]|tara:strand:- start:26463 stop:26702 length:240 start_codon:yes stop_codon:yes gene_type:complete
MKKATSKRERKYGKKHVEDEVKSKTKVYKKKKKSKKVKLMIDYAYIREFKSEAEADKFINEQNEKADKRKRSRPSFVYL